MNVETAESRWRAVPLYMLALLIGASALSFGSVEIWAREWLRVGGLLTLVAIAWRTPLKKMFGGTPGRLALPVVLLVLWGMVQAVPLPRPVLWPLRVVPESVSHPIAPALHRPLVWPRRPRPPLPPTGVVWPGTWKSAVRTGPAPGRTPAIVPACAPDNRTSAPRAAVPAAAEFPRAMKNIEPCGRCPPRTPHHPVPRPPD